MALGLMIPPGTASAATQEHIGNWVLTCPGDAPRPGPCLLQLERRFLDKAGIIAGLEVQALGNILVPVITLRGLSSELLIAASLAGKTEASMQFGGSPREDLACTPSSLGYICAPRDGAAQRLAARLPWARLVTVRVSVAPAGMKPLPAQEKSLDLSGTSGALARLRTAGPAQVPDPLTALSSQTPATFMEMADKALKAAGYPNGMANLQGLLAKYREK
jgi:hypothetical protein